MIFEDHFRKSKGQPVRIGGRTYCLVKSMEVKRTTSFCIDLQNAKPPYRQGIHLSGDAGLIVNGVTANEMVLWADTMPPSVCCVVKAPSTLHVWNVWDIGNGAIQRWHNGAAMWIEPVENGHVFHCNEGQPDDLCDDLVFRVSLKKTADDQGATVQEGPSTRRGHQSDSNSKTRRSR
jgi:hypothetical protein